MSKRKKYVQEFEQGVKSVSCKEREDPQRSHKSKGRVSGREK
jgi:hypothetical protein